jgi:hypothetical protein
MGRVGQQEVPEKGDGGLAVRGNARVEHRDADAGAVDSHHAPREEGAALHTRPEVEGVDCPVVAGVERVGVRPDRLQLAVGNIEDVGVNQREVAGARVFLEFRWQLRALHANDDAGGLRRWRVPGSVVELVVELGVLLRSARRERT